MSQTAKAFFAIASLVSIFLVAWISTGITILGYLAALTLVLSLLVIYFRTIRDQFMKIYTLIVDFFFYDMSIRISILEIVVICVALLSIIIKSYKYSHPITNINASINETSVQFSEIDTSRNYDSRADATMGVKQDKKWVKEYDSWVANSANNKDYSKNPIELFKHEFWIAEGVFEIDWVGSIRIENTSIYYYKSKNMHSVSDEIIYVAEQSGGHNWFMVTRRYGSGELRYWRIKKNEETGGIEGLIMGDDIISPITLMPTEWSNPYQLPDSLTGNNQ